MSSPAAPRRVALVGPSLRGGGAERVLVTLATALAARGHDVRVVTVYGRRGDVYTLPASIPRVDLDLGANSGDPLRGAFVNMGRVRALRRALATIAPDVAVSFLSEVNVLAVLAAGDGRRVVVTEHIDPRHFRIGAPWRLLRRAIYPRAGRLVAPSRGVADCYAWLDPARRLVIPNPIPRVEGGAATRRGSAAEGLILGVGRLAPQKGFDLLIRAFAAATTERRGWRLEIVGAGPERESLERLARELGVGDRVLLRGWVDDPQERLRAADLFVLSSRYEGFGNVIVEAMHAGTPVVSFDCPSGPSELFQAGEQGVLVPAGSVRQLTESMESLMADPERRRGIAAAAHTAAARFLPETIAVAWEELFASMDGDLVDR